MADSDFLSGNVEEEIGQGEGKTNECEISGDITTENREPSDTEGIQLYGTDKEQVWDTETGRYRHRLSTENLYFFIHIIKCQSIYYNCKISSRSVVK